MLTILQVHESICIAFSIHCKRTRSIATLIQLYLFSRVPNRGLSQQGKTGDMQSELKASELIAQFTSGDAKDYAHWVITNEGEKCM